MTLPRVAYLKNITRVGYTLVNEIYNLAPLYDADEPLAYDASLGNGSVFVDYSDLPSGAVYFQINATNIPTVNLTGTANFTFTSSVSGETVRGGFFFGGDVPVWIDRGGARGFDNPFLTDKFSTNNLIANGTWRMEGVIDRSILEIFLDGGERSATNTFFPTQPLDTLLISTGELNAGVEVSVAIYGLDCSWDPSARNTSYRQTSYSRYA
ncbi:MAG TPA: GH32 C-terminal domain-containing protein [Thermoanaerobaculia bacterium]